jgi:Primase C terminal 2 (PriCT-2)/RepB DNA-primase N-terminal domain
MSHAHNAADHFAETERFLRLLDPGAPVFTFQTFLEKGNDDNPNVHPQIIHDKTLSKLREEHDLGAGIYVVVNQTDGTGRKTENIVRVRAVWQEDDDGYNGAFPLQPSIVVESSPGHYHRYWLVDDEWPADKSGRTDLAGVMERMVETYGSDKYAKDITRVLRLPGFLHRKAAPFMVRIIGGNEKRYTRAEILAAFPPVVREKTEPRQKEWTPRHDEDERIREALDYIDADPRDLWRDVGMALKEHLGEAGRSLWDAWSKRSSKFNERRQESAWRSFRRHDTKIGTLFHHAKQGGWKAKRHSDGGNETNTDYNRAANMGGDNSTPERTAVLVRADSLEPESINWAWKNRLAFGKMAMLAGDPGLGKSSRNFRPSSEAPARVSWDTSTTDASTTGERSNERKVSYPHGSGFYSNFTIDQGTEASYSSYTIGPRMISPFPFAQRPVEFIAGARG